MRVHNDGGVGDAAYHDDDGDGDTEDIEAGDDDKDVHIWPLGKRAGTPRRAKGSERGGGRGRSGGRGGRGGASEDGGKSATYWKTKEQMLLVGCKREQDMHKVGLGHNYGWMRTREWKWEDIAKRLAALGTVKDAGDCFQKWDNLFQNYKKRMRFQRKSGEKDFFRLTNEERKEHNSKFRMERTLYKEIHASMLGNHTIFPPNVADTGSPEEVQLPRRETAAGESVGSEGGSDGCLDERSPTKDSDQNAGSGATAPLAESGRMHVSRRLSQS
ncbi:hypothetical protein CBR_g37988 [Chara braunii]|uniref:Myb-like domain-containing protein n=1 Tax=Chara braunii TaxID=69332 RepID=A0A388LPH4_CHABU|nr:hypothetical protein CBR_g37988 [Chara braunii]|eukprot:GBG84113.1 hypothetical protein CBR_g37988 [Chara braunii]